MARPRRRFFLGVLAVVLCIASFATLHLALGWKRALDDVEVMTMPTVILPTIEPTQAPPQYKQVVAAVPPTLQPEPELPKEPDQPVNILLLGADARGSEDVSRTDAIIVVHIDPRADRISMLSIPRDLWVDVPGYGKHRINAAYPIGEARIGPGYGPALAKKTVSDLLNIPIHHFMLINFEGFEKLIDKLGGVTIDVAEPIYDPKYPVDAFEGDTRTITVRFDAGVQQMDGTRALVYARTRYTDSDFGRNRRQQQVLMAIFDRVRERGLFAQLTSLDEYTSALRDYVRFDLSRDDMLSLARMGPRLRSENIHRYAVDSTMIIHLREPATFAADPKDLKQLVNQMLGGSVAAADGEKLAP